MAQCGSVWLQQQGPRTLVEPSISRLWLQGLAQRWACDPGLTNERLGAWETSEALSWVLCPPLKCVTHGLNGAQRGFG